MDANLSLLHNRRTRERVWISALAFAVAAAVVAPAAANAGTAGGPRSAGEEVVALCIARSAGGHDWLERTLWGLRDQEGGWIGAEIPNSDGSHDLGPMQVNSWWVEKLAVATKRPVAAIRRWLINDACFNVDAARWIFLSALSRLNDYWLAVGTYHSPTPSRQRQYIRSVAVHLKRRFGKDIFGR